MELEFTNPWLLLLSPLALIPLFRSTRKAVPYSSIAMLPPDWLSSFIFTLIRLIAAMVILFLILGLAEPFYKQHTRERFGTGAHIILLLDRSASMNENFTGRYFGGKPKETKVAIARQVLTDFVDRRQNDFFAMISFSTTPIPILPLTQENGHTRSHQRHPFTRPGCYQHCPWSFYGPGLLYWTNNYRLPSYPVGFRWRCTYRSRKTKHTEAAVQTK